CQDQVQAHHERGRVDERGCRVQTLSPVEHGKPRGFELEGSRSFLQANQTDAGDARYRLKLAQREGTLAVAFVGGVTLPGNADLEAWPRSQLPPPLAGELGVRAQIGNFGRDVGKRGAQKTR